MTAVRRQEASLAAFPLGLPLMAVVVVLVSLGGCSGSDADDRAGSTAARSTSSSEVPVTSSTLTDRNHEFPPARGDVEHGGATWAVVLAGAEAIDAPALRDAEAAAKDAGYTTGPTDCDMGAKEALGLSSDGPIYTVSVYFTTEAAARQAFAAFRAGGFRAGAVAEVRTFCLD